MRASDSNVNVNCGNINDANNLITIISQYHFVGVRETSKKRHNFNSYLFNF